VTQGARPRRGTCNYFFGLRVPRREGKKEAEEAEKAAEEEEEEERGVTVSSSQHPPGPQSLQVPGG
jgi:hypothetical protein